MTGETEVGRFWNWTLFIEQIATEFSVETDALLANPYNSVASNYVARRIKLGGALHKHRICKPTAHQSTKGCEGRS
ncbi:hypothetical protein MNBD_ALPHA09-1892 [hydrothermal vent metagenome]|uniref:Uncharacterized protein n=1 Tax=hydrothermal vent metagenome TaxID=652676 RepID=A0A3B0T3A8_9ZZZZ